MRFNEALINQYSDMQWADLHIDPTPEKMYIIALRKLGVENTTSLLSFDPSSISNQNKGSADKILRQVIESGAPSLLKSYAAILIIELHAPLATYDVPTDNLIKDCYMILKTVRKTNPYAALLFAQYKMSTGHISEAVDLIKQAANFRVASSVTHDRHTIKLFDELLVESNTLLSASAMGSLIILHENLIKHNAQSKPYDAFLLAENLLRKNRWMEGIYFLIHGCKLVTSIQDLSLDERQRLENTIMTIILPYLSARHLLTSGKEQAKYSLCRIFAHYFVQTSLYPFLRDSFNEKSPDVFARHEQQNEDRASIGSYEYSFQTHIMMKAYFAAHRLDSIDNLRDLLKSQSHWIEKHRTEVPYLNFLCATLDQKAGITRADCKELRKNLQNLEESHLFAYVFTVGIAAMIWLVVQSLCVPIVVDNTSLLAIMLFLIPTWILIAIALSYPLYNLGKLLCEYISDSCRIIFTSHPTKLLGDEIVCEKLLREFDTRSSKLAAGFSSIENLCQSVGDTLEELPPPYDHGPSGAGALVFS